MDETRNKEASSTLPSCAMCHKHTAIYRCPRCHTCTCSLDCCRAHKVSRSQSVCNGKRDRTKFCSLKGFTDTQLASDYHFLEDVLKVSEGSKRLYKGLVSGTTSSTSSTKRLRVDASSGGGKVAFDSISQAAPMHPLLKARDGKSVVEVLAHGVDDVPTTSEGDRTFPGSVALCEKDATIGPNSTNNTKPKVKVDPLVRQTELKEINLLRMPPGMQRRLSNTTKFNKKDGVITWKIELWFHSPSGEGGNKHTFKVESHAPDCSTLAEELGKHLDIHPDNATARSALRVFASAPRQSLRLYLKRLPSSSSAPQYFRLDPAVSLASSLKGKTIIEFPTIDVALEGDEERFPLLIGELI